MTRLQPWAWTLVACLFCAANLPGQQSGTVPRLIKFSGEVSPQISQIKQIKEGEDGKSQSPAIVGLGFSLYELQEGGSPLWSESQKVQLDEQGRYTVLLGATQNEGLPLELFTSGKALWLGVQPHLPGAVEQPRVLLVAVPYALKASDADTLGGLPASAFLPATASQLGGAASVSGLPGSASFVNGQRTTDDGLRTSGPQPGAACGAITSDGTAAANSIALFTTNCNLEASAITQTSGNIGISGASPAGTKFQITDAPAANFGTHYTNHELLNSSVTRNGTNKGLTFVMDATNMAISPGVTDSGYRIGVEGAAYANTTGFAGTLRAQYGVWGRAGINNATSGAAVTNAYAGYFDMFNGVAGTTITNAYGVYIANSATTGTITNRYDLYASSVNANNYFAGNVGIGTTTPAAKLEVNGNSQFDLGVTFKKPVTFVTGQTFAGTGTVTSVASGAGLTGGPITSKGTLSIATGGVTDTMLAGSYAGTGVCAANGVVTGLHRNAGPSCGNAGSVTSVGSGAGLAGGPITTSGALFIPAGGVQDVMLANAYAGAGPCPAGQFATNLRRNVVPGCATAVTSVTAGAGLAAGGFPGGTITGDGVLSIFNGGVVNAMLANPNVTVMAGNGLAGGGVVALGGTTTLTVDPTKVPILASANTFAATQTINNGNMVLSNGNLALPDSTNGNAGVITVGGTPFMHDCCGAANLDTFVGLSAGSVDGTTNMGNGNTGVGYQALTSVASGEANTAVGVNALSKAVNGLGNTAVGYNALQSYAGTPSETAVGSFALQNDTSTTGQNTALGATALQLNTKGFNNTAAGFNALNANKTGDDNTALGDNALLSNTGDENTAVGSGALMFNTTGGGNTAVGWSSGGTNAETCDKCTFLGYNANTGADGLTNATAIGAGSTVSESNAIVLGFGSETIGIGTTTPNRNFQLDVEGSVMVGGNLNVTGAITAGTKDFKIDDPVDPNHKYLYHASIESSEMKNMYDGVATLDTNGEAVVELPAWFEALNRDFRYQLTAVGAPGPNLYIKEKVRNNRFRIGGGEPGAEVSWQVTGIRHDTWANAHPLRVEEEKSLAEHGHD